MQHEFVNTTATHAGRTRFAVNDRAWEPTTGFGNEQKALVVEMLHDWGTGLTRAPYEEATIHFCGRPAKVLAEIDVSLGQVSIATQTVPLCAEKRRNQADDV